MPTINMLSSADKVKGQGVSSAYFEQVKLVEKGLGKTYKIMVNKFKLCDIMHYHTIDFKHYLTIPFARMKGVNVGYVHFLPETLTDSIKLPLIAEKSFYKYLISFYKSMDYLVTVNPYFIKLLSKYKIDKNKITFIPNYVSDTQFYSYEPAKRIEAKKRFGFKEDSFVVLGAGQIQTRKGILDFLEVAEKCPNVQFVWAGGFSFGHISAGYKDLKEVIKTPPKNVEFLGIVDRDTMNDIYNMSDLLFVPSYHELFPMVVLEAFNCKKPIILRDLEVYEDVFFDFYLKGNTVPDFIKLISQLREDPDYYEKCSQQSWKGHDMYCEENVLKMWKDFYDKVSDAYTKKHNDEYIKRHSAEYIRKHSEGYVKKRSAAYIKKHGEGYVKKRSEKIQKRTLGE